MAKYTILVEKTLSRLVDVEAQDYAEAEEIVQRMYDNKEIVLDDSDLIDDVQIEYWECEE